MSEIRDLIEEYQRETVFWENQSNQWQALATALACRNQDRLGLLTTGEMKAASNMILEPKQLKKGVKLTLAEVPDGS